MSHRAPHVLVVGEALIDEVQRADGTVDDHPGGSPANVALTLGRLGRETSLAAHLGQDEGARRSAPGSPTRAWPSHPGPTAQPPRASLAPSSTGRGQRRTTSRSPGTWPRHRSDRGDDRRPHRLHRSSPRARRDRCARPGPRRLGPRDHHLRPERPPEPHGHR
ncbi:PfkB family carbohydrate kinase [Oerskovia sp. M15]